MTAPRLEVRMLKFWGRLLRTFARRGVLAAPVGTLVGFVFGDISQTVDAMDLILGHTPGLGR